MVVAAVTAPLRDDWQRALTKAEAAKEEGLSTEQAGNLIRISAKAAAKQKGEGTVLTLFVIDGEYHTAFSPKTAPLIFDSSIEVIRQIALGEKAEQIKLKNRFK